MMKTTTILLLVCVTLGAGSAVSADEGWISLFDGETLDGWKASENQGTFSVKEGQLVVYGARSHLFYVGPVNNANFRNFEFRADVMTTKGSNSGIYFHTEYQQTGWPGKGYECQVNTTHSDRKKTGGLYGVQDVIDDAPSIDGQWFRYYIKVEGDRIIIKIDGKTTVDWVQPRGWDRGGRKIDRGTFAIQGHDPKSLVYYANIAVRPLLDSPGWVSLFDGKSLDGWKASENKDTFSVKDGLIVAHGPRSHLFYTGPVNNADFTNFEFMADVKTEKGSNSGIYFHTEYQETGWPDKGYEVQVNNTHSDWRKTGGLYAVDDVRQPPSKDGEWFTEHIIVRGKSIEIRVNGETTVKYTEPPNVAKEGYPNMPGRKVSHGTFALQGHDPKSIVYYRDIMVKPLEPIKAVVVTGGHDFEREPFFAMFDSYADIDYVEAIQKDHSELFEDISDWDYDVIVLYNMSKDISPKRQENFKALLRDKGVGLVALHHAEGAYPNWDEYRRIIGAKYPLTDQTIDGVAFKTGTFKHDVDLTVQIADSDHPITCGLKDFAIHDETYHGLWFAEDNQVLLTTDHATSDKTIGWTRPDYGKARVVFLQGGHDGKAYANPNYCQLVGQAIRWAAGVL
ncbi:MAG: DUF1080 domain-containing protein [Phycisphaerales bacterium]|nr:MAG: DUF1080 domain-containing protein [Phycisphaerales bacterium]